MGNIRWDKVLLLPFRFLWQCVTWFFHFPPTLSYGRISTYLACPLKYKFQFIDQVPQKTSAQLAFGSVLHKTLEEFHKNCNLKTAAEDDLLYFLDKNWNSEGYSSPEEEDEFHSKAVKILKKYFADNKGLEIRIKYLEKAVEDKIGGFEMKGRFDRVDQRADGKLDVIDYKTGKTLDERQLKRELQAKLYYYFARRLWGKKFGNLIFYYLESGRKVDVKFTVDELMQMVQTVRETGQAISRKEFEPSPSALCAWCDYMSSCPAWKNRQSKKDVFRISYSKLMTYKLCPRNYKNLYVDKNPPQPRSFFTLGIAVHGALEEFYQYDGYLKEPSLKWLLELLRKNWVSAGFNSKEEEMKLYHEAENILKVYYRDWIQGKFKRAFAVEPYFELPVGEKYVAIGYIDKIDELPDGSLEVIDYKTEPKIRTQQEVDEDLQLTIYYWACIQNYGKAPARVTLHFMRHNKQISTTRSQKDIDYLIDYLQQMGEDMQNDKEYLPKLNKYCISCDVLVGCPLEQEARKKAQEEAESYHKVVELVRETQTQEAEEVQV